MRWILIAFVASLALLSPARSGELVVLSSVGAKSALELLKPEFEQQGHRLSIHYDTAAALKRGIDLGLGFDVALLTSAISKSLTKESRLIDSEHRIFAYAKIGLAAKAGSPKPDISSTEAFTRALLAANTISHARDGASGQYFRKLIKQLGIEDQLSGKLLPMTGSKEIEAVADGHATYGVQLISEIISVKGVEFVAPFPPALQNVTELDLDISASATDPELARQFVTFLGSEKARATIFRAGLDPP